MECASGCGRTVPSRDMAARLATAADTLKRLPASGLRPHGVRSAWPDVVRSVQEAYGYERARMRPPPPTPEAIDDLDRCLDLVRTLSPDDQRLVWARALGARWQPLCRKFGVSRSTLWRRWAMALEALSKVNE